MLSRVWVFVTPWMVVKQAPCPSPTPRACSNSWPLSRWCHPTISSSVVPFSSCLQSCPASGSFLTSSVQFIHSVVSDSLWPHGRQHARPPCPSATPSLLKLMSTESVMPSNHLILSRPLLLPPSIFLSIRVFSNELALHRRRPKYWSFSFSIGPSNEYWGLISFRIDWFDLFEVQGTLKSSPTPQFKSVNSLALSLLYGPTLTSIHDYW